MDNQAGQEQITGRFFEFYGKKAFTADVQAETITRLKAENEQLRQENEKIKNLYDEQVKQGSSDHDVS